MILLVFIFGGLIVLFIFAVLKAKENYENGVMIPRKGQFWRQAEIFTLNADWDTVWNVLKDADYHKAISSGKVRSGKRVVDYTGLYFNAEFGQLNTDENEPYKYMFSFTQWKTHKGVTSGTNEMNILMTTIEKCLLSLDPNTQVHTEYKDIKTKTSIF